MTSPGWGSGARPPLILLIILRLINSFLCAVFEAEVVYSYWTTRVLPYNK